MPLVLGYNCMPHAILAERMPGIIASFLSTLLLFQGIAL